MKQSSLLLFILCSIFHLSKAQNTYLKDNAVNIEKLNVLSDQVYTMLSTNRIIMVGEQHGTNEPVKFVTGLAEVFANHGDSVQVGFEIPPKEMEEYLKHHTENSITQSKFFTESTDGRGSLAWAGAIAQLSKNPRITIFFYDINTGELGNRDSLMYVNIKNNLMKHPARKIITIGGNIHNRMVPYKGKNTVASYLLRDTQLNLTEKFSSLDHYYLEGSERNNIGNGLELRTISNPPSAYSSLGYENYVVPMHSPDYPYSGMLYTKHVTAAEMMKPTK
ncbi:MAG TPA: hypothetical protein VFE57_13300 [Cyclobacteriaceae bacterium]|jgi:hypothetical protein|nr:hypothetical protein [Cyclobacteriaceae bacterium]